jgi:rSAM/selenodomain-associated transferase 2
MIQSMGSPRLSIIIPVLNEAEILEKSLECVIAHSTASNIEEIIMVDGGSTDGTLRLIEGMEHVTLIRSEKGRARQMNTGARSAKGEILYFLHADSFPPKAFDEKILSSGAKAGCFRLKFDDPHSIWLKIAPWFTQFPSFLFRGGDQSLFIEAETFQKTGGFDERYAVYEDVEFIRRICKHHRFEIINDYVTTSARRFRENGATRLYYHFLVVHFKAWMGKSPEALHDYYRRHIS